MLKASSIPVFVAPQACFQHSALKQLRRASLDLYRQGNARIRGAALTCRASAPRVLLTREKGKNGKLAKMLDQRQIAWTELPLIETVTGPDRSVLADVIRQALHQWTVITSPEAAAVFLQGWKEAGQPKVKIAVVGDGTSQVLSREQCPELLEVAFTPSKANAKHLSAELPLNGSGRKVLYPASKKARQELQHGLEERGCEVTRLNTYDTVHVGDLSQEDMNVAKAAEVVAIASPSAIEAWVDLIGTNPNLAIACIGSTSATAARALGFERIFCTDSPGLDGFVGAIEEALASFRASAH